MRRKGVSPFFAEDVMKFMIVFRNMGEVDRVFGCGGGGSASRDLRDVGEGQLEDFSTGKFASAGEGCCIDERDRRRGIPGGIGSCGIYDRIGRAGCWRVFFGKLRGSRGSRRGRRNGRVLWRNSEVINTASRPVNQQIVFAEPVVSKNECSGGVQRGNKEGEGEDVACRVTDGKVDGTGDPSIGCSVDQMKLTWGHGISHKIIVINKRRVYETMCRSAIY